MNQTSQRDRLFHICQKNILSNDDMGNSERRVILPEPYIPYMPDDWDRGTLVLAEAQYLHERTDEGKGFMAKMRDVLDVDGRINHLYMGEVLFENPNWIGVGPWDEGALKLAVHAAFGLEPSQCAVSNGILWSEVDSNGSSLNPEWGSPCFKKSIGLWSKMLKVMQPSVIVTAGQKAAWVIDDIFKDSRKDERPEIFRLTHPSPRNINRLKKPFRVSEDLLPRYPEVQDMLKHYEGLFQNLNDKEVAIYFACHAVSQHRMKARNAK